MVTINRLVEMVAEIAGKKLYTRHIPGPLGVRGRNSDNRLIWEKLDWKPGKQPSGRPRKDLCVDRCPSAFLARSSGGSLSS